YHGAFARLAYQRGFAAELAFFVEASQGAAPQDFQQYVAHALVAVPLGRETTASLLLRGSVLVGLRLIEEDVDEGWTNAAVVVAACGGGAGMPAPVEDLDAGPGSFTCLQGWTAVRRFRVTNTLGHLDAALAVANAPDGGGRYPVGTILQLIPIEAMVKRRAG